MMHHRIIRLLLSIAFIASGLIVVFDFSNSVLARGSRVHRGGYSGACFKRCSRRVGIHRPRRLRRLYSSHLSRWARFSLRSIFFSRRSDTDYDSVYYGPLMEANPSAARNQGRLALVFGDTRMARQSFQLASSIQRVQRRPGRLTASTKTSVRPRPTTAAKLPKQTTASKQPSTKPTKTTNQKSQKASKAMVDQKKNQKTTNSQKQDVKNKTSQPSENKPKSQQSPKPKQTT